MTHVFCRNKFEVPQCRHHFGYLRPIKTEVGIPSFKVNNRPIRSFIHLKKSWCF